MKLTPKEDLRDWLVDNFDAVSDTIDYACKRHAELNGWDVADVDILSEELSDVLKEGILNVIDTYQE